MAAPNALTVTLQADTTAFYVAMYRMNNEAAGQFQRLADKFRDVAYDAARSAGCRCDLFASPALHEQGCVLRDLR